MVTLPTPERAARRRQAIADYMAQDHASRELIVIIDPARGGDPVAVVDEVRSLGRSDVKAIIPPLRGSLGALRNGAVTAAQGAIICQWDDDDRHHPSRISAGLAALDRQQAGAAILQDVLLLDERRGALSWTNWSRTPARGHPATLIASRATLPRYPEKGAAAEQGEDLAVAELLQKAGRLAPLTGAPHLYIYVDHGTNVSSAEHHAMLRRELAISAGLLERRKPALLAALAPFDLAAVTLEGRQPG